MGTNGEHLRLRIKPKQQYLGAVAFGLANCRVDLVSPLGYRFII